MRKIAFPFVLVLMVVGMGYYAATNYNNFLKSQQQNLTLSKAKQNLQQKLNAAQSQITQLKESNSNLKVKVKTASQIKPVCPKQTQQPPINNFTLQVWANVAAVRAYSFNFMNYQSAFNSSQHYFTATAWPLFKAALESSGMISTMLNDKMVVSAVATGAVTIIPISTIKGSESWQAIMPLKVTLASSSKKLNQNLNVTMTIVKTNQPDNIQGLAINSFKATLALKGNNKQ